MGCRADAAAADDDDDLVLCHLITRESLDSFWSNFMSGVPWSPVLRYLYGSKRASEVIILKLKIKRQ
jgi:hypothetical protein